MHHYLCKIVNKIKHKIVYRVYVCIIYRLFINLYNNLTLQYYSLINYFLNSKPTISIFSHLLAYNFIKELCKISSYIHTLNYFLYNT